MSCDFIQNKTCEYFPCHDGIPAEQFNCLFCFCPLYALGQACGGNFTYTAEGIKDCSRCLRPHEKGQYAQICQKLNQVIEMVKKP